MKFDLSKRNVEVSEEIRDYFDKVIFSVISKDEQLNRLTKRESKYYLQKYLNYYLN